jgi:succinate dehydrogenase (ubiquinone) membrane anchor subunit
VFNDGPLAVSAVVADYVPRALQVPARVGVLGLSTITFLGLMKLSLLGPGVSGAIKELWRGKATA